MACPKVFSYVAMISQIYLQENEEIVLDEIVTHLSEDQFSSIARDFTVKVPSKNL